MEYLVVDVDNRKIIIPESITHLGVKDDNETRTLNFRMPKIYKGLDMSGYTIEINFINANGKGDSALAKNIQVGDEEITFQWCAGGTVYAKDGKIRFLVYTYLENEDGTRTNEWHTTWARLEVLEGGNVDEQIAKENPRIIEEMLRRIRELENGETGGTKDAIQYIEQELTDEQKAQARTNIGAVSNEEVDSKIKQMISEQSHFRFEKVDVLPDVGEENVIYLVPGKQEEENIYEEYLFVDGVPELIGSTQIDLSGYAPKATTIAGYGITDGATKEEVGQLRQQIADYVGGIDGAIGTTFPPSQKPASTEFDGYDIDVLNVTANDIYAYIDEVVNGKNTVTKEILGKDASGKYDVARYIFANREHIAWVKENYPKMYAWKNGNIVIYSTSVAPRIGDKMYKTKYIGDAYGTQSGTTEVNVPPKVVIVKGKRYSMSGGGWKDAANAATIVVPTDFESVQDQMTVVVTGANAHNTYTGFYCGTEKNIYTLDASRGHTNGTYTLNVPSNAVVGQAYGCFFFAYSGTETFETTTVTLDGVSAEVIVTDNIDDVMQVAHATTETVESGEVVATVTAVSATNRSRTINGLEFVRYEEDDVKPTVIYTDSDDERNGNTTITQDGITYNRYPMGDLGANRSKLIPIFIYANEHGIFKDTATNGPHETKMCALVASRLLRDLSSDKQYKNPLYKFIRENCMLIVIPVANPFGYNYNLTDDLVPCHATWNTGYINANAVNINRNYDTSGWDVSVAKGEGHHGVYAGSENETQYIMNTMTESDSVVAMSLHGHRSQINSDMVQGQNPDGTYYNTNSLSKISTFLQNNYGYVVEDYDVRIYGYAPGGVYNMPDTTCKSPSYITQCGAYGGIVEFPYMDVSDGNKMYRMSSHVIENAYAFTLNLMAMWLSDYLEQ